MVNKTDELLREFAEKYKTSQCHSYMDDTTGLELHQSDNVDLMLSDLRTLIDKLMPTMTDDEIKAEICKDDPVMDSDNEWLYGYRYGRLIGAKWFRNRMKGEQK